MSSDTDFRPSNLPAFTGESGLHFQVPDSSAYFVLKILDQELLATLAEWTNKKAATEPNIIRKYKDDKRVHTRQWNDVTTNEMSKFIGMVFLMGVVQEPELQDYFTTNYLIETPLPSFAVTIFCREIGFWKFYVICVSTM